MPRWAVAVGMKRRWFAVAGLLVLVLDAYVVVQLGPTSGGALPPVLIALAGLLFVAGGLDPLPATVPWYRFVGAASVLAGALFLVVWTVPALAGAPSTNDLVLALAGAFNALVLGLVGADVYGGGHYFDLSTFEPGPLFAGGAE